MAKEVSDSASMVRLNVGGKKFCTTLDTLTHREPDSMLAAMFSGRHTVSRDTEKGYVFVDRDGKNFRHILNWLRDGVVPTLTGSKYLELLREAEYYQLLGLIEKINAVVIKTKEENEVDAELTRTDIIKCIQSEKVRFRGINLSGLDLSKLDLSFADFSYACLKGVFFSRAYLQCAKFRDVDGEGSIFHNATLRECEFTGANLRGALLAGANLQSANLQGNFHLYITPISYAFHCLISHNYYILSSFCLLIDKLFHETVLHIMTWTPGYSSHLFFLLFWGSFIHVFKEKCEISSPRTRNSNLWHHFSEIFIPTSFERNLWLFCLAIVMTKNGRFLCCFLFYTIYSWHYLYLNFIWIQIYLVILQMLV
ncbi:hypothetical protein Ddye_026079 [Dipteronia dyeriana]|uniref:BTB domain-containing protein n=1 Tax=Dipteronia dyeriana TaxID=168575 RepID=A0AAD9TME9_9ROSI|nr:hypothetical protein Ddye_026079 [Dipteronia dyeriana]